MAAGSQLVESLGEKAGPSPAREKNPFFLRSHAVQLARVSRKTIKKLVFDFHFLHSHVPFIFILFRNLPNPKLLVHNGPKASKSTKSTRVGGKGFFRNLLVLCSGKYYGLRGERERDRDRSADEYLHRTTDRVSMFTYLPVPCMGAGIAFHRLFVVLQMFESCPKRANSSFLNGVAYCLT